MHHGPEVIATALAGYGSSCTSSTASAETPAQCRRSAIFAAVECDWPRQDDIGAELSEQPHVAVLGQQQIAVLWLPFPLQIPRSNPHALIVPEPSSGRTIPPGGRKCVRRYTTHEVKASKNRIRAIPACGVLAGEASSPNSGSRARVEAGTFRLPLPTRCVVLASDR